MGHSGTRWRSHPTSVEIKAELVLGIHGRPYDSSGCATGHGQTSWRKGRGGQGKSCGVRVSAGPSCFSHRTSRSGFGLRACFSGVCRLKGIPPATRRMSNPSWKALSAQGKDLGGGRIFKRCLPGSLKPAIALTTRRGQSRFWSCPGQTGDPPTNYLGWGVETSALGCQPVLRGVQVEETLLGKTSCR